MASNLNRIRATTRANLAAAVYGQGKVSREEANRLVAMTLTEIIDALSRSENVRLSTFGSFLVRFKRERMGRNPKTGVDSVISARRVVVFKASRIMGARINDRALPTRHRERAFREERTEDCGGDR